MEEVAVLRTRVDNLEHRFDDHERRQNGTMEGIRDELKEMNKKIDGRPSWAVSLLLTAALTVIGWLIGMLQAGGGAS